MENFAYEQGIRNGQVQEQMLNIQDPFDFSNREHIQELRPIIEQLVREGYKSENTGIAFRNNLPTITIGEKEIQKRLMSEVLKILPCFQVIRLRCYDQKKIFRNFPLL